MGRKTHYNDERHRLFIEAVSLGTTVTGAAGRAGWRQRTAFRYLARGRTALRLVSDEDQVDLDEVIEQVPKDDRPFVRLHVEYETALQASEASILAQLLHDGKGDWRAKAWLLERRWPGRFSNRRRSPEEKVKLLAETKKANAESALAEWRLEQAKQGTAGGGRLLMPEDLLLSMRMVDPELAERFASFLAESSLSLARRTRLGEGVTQADIDEVSPTTH
jgi:hypothetical protein